MTQNTRRHIAIVGAGLAGLSAAIKLLQHGHQVSVFEAAPQAGGRTRSVSLAQGTLDNGQHLCIGAYHATLELIHAAGLEADEVFTRIPLALHMHDGARTMSLVTPRWLPAPLHLLWGLLTARGLTWHTKWRAITWMQQLKKQAFRLQQDMPVSDLLLHGRQTDAAIKLLWEPLCLAALNTPISLASAQIFLNVLRDSFQQQRSDSDFLVMKSDLSSALIEPLARQVTASGGTLALRNPVFSVQSASTGCLLETADDEQWFDAVILAVGPHQLKTVKSDLPIPAFDYHPITTVYLQYGPQIRLPYPLLGLCHGFAQWVFDRGQCCQQPGLLAVVISAHGPLADKAALVRQCIAELNQALAAYQITLTEDPVWTQVITEKRATFSCTPALQRPETVTASRNIYLAGDYIAGPHPATIESAVRSGFTAAEKITHADS